MGNISETSNQKTVASVVGKNTALGDGVFVLPLEQAEVSWEQATTSQG
jgi:hypothetical protein